MNYPDSVDFLYALGSDGDLVCLKTADGAKVWHKNLRGDFGGQPGMWAYAESRLIDGDTIGRHHLRVGGETAVPGKTSDRAAGNRTNDARGRHLANPTVD